MENVVVKKEELLAKIRANRERHEEAFVKALEVYREVAIEKLEMMLDDARKGREIRQHVGLPVPEEHTDDYDRAITMLEMSVDENVELSESDFAMYVMDEWGWMRNFHTNTMSYSERK